MTIKMMTDQAIEKCRTDAEELARKVYGNPNDSEWLAAFVGGDPFVEKNFDIPEFELEVPVRGSSDEREVVVRNAIILHKALKGLPAYVLGDMRFWAWITFTKGYRFAIYRSEIKADYIKNNWFATTDNNRRATMLQTLGMEYFIADLTFKSAGSEDYSLTPYLSNNRELYRNMVYRNLSDIPAVAEGLIKAWADFAAEGQTPSTKSWTDAYRASMKFISSLGSVRLVDMMTADEIYTETKAYLESI